MKKTFYKILFILLGAGWYKVVIEKETININ